jgi:hypothetical protein
MDGRAGVCVYACVCVCARARAWRVWGAEEAAVGGTSSLGVVPLGSALARRLSTAQETIKSASKADADRGLAEEREREEVRSWRKVGAGEIGR